MQVPIGITFPCEGGTIGGIDCSKCIMTFFIGIRIIFYAAQHTIAIEQFDISVTCSLNKPAFASGFIGIFPNEFGEIIVIHGITSLALIDELTMNNNGIAFSTLSFYPAVCWEIGGQIKDIDVAIFTLYNLSHAAISSHIHQAIDPVTCITTIACYHIVEECSGGLLPDNGRSIGIGSTTLLRGLELVIRPNLGFNKLKRSGW